MKNRIKGKIEGKRNLALINLLGLETRAQ